VDQPLTAALSENGHDRCVDAYLDGAGKDFIKHMRRVVRLYHFGNRYLDTPL